MLVATVRYLLIFAAVKIIQKYRTPWANFRKDAQDICLQAKNDGMIRSGKNIDPEYVNYLR